MKRILCTGVESSGTKLTTDLLRKAGKEQGVEVIHSSPNYRAWMGRPPHRGSDFDAVVLVVRSSHTNIRSMVENEHAVGKEHARFMLGAGLRYILEGIDSETDLHVVTLEALIYERDALVALCEDLGLDPNFPHYIGNPNEKYFGSGPYFRDSRSLEER